MCFHQHYPRPGISIVILRAMVGRTSPKSQVVLVVVTLLLEGALLSNATDRAVLQDLVNELEAVVVGGPGGAPGITERSTYLYPLEDLITDVFENITNRLNLLEEGVARCRQTNFEELHSTLDEKFRDMTDILISNINTAMIGSGSTSGHGAPNPAACLPPFEKKALIGCVYISDPSATLTWRMAKAKCEDMGAQLIVNPPLASLLHYIKGKAHGTTDFWIGGKYSDNWRWLDGRIISGGWNANEPDSNASDSCVYFNWNGEGLLNDHICDETKMFICETMTN